MGNYNIQTRGCLSYVHYIVLKSWSNIVVLFILTMTCMQQYILLGRDAGINKFLFDPILENIHNATHIIIPLHHEEKYHFTMMYLDKAEGTWFHVNPIKPRRNGDQYNRCFRDASRMVRRLQSDV